MTIERAGVPAAAQAAPEARAAARVGVLPLSFAALARLEAAADALMASRSASGSAGNGPAQERASDND